MKHGLKIAISWLCLFLLFISPMSVFGATSSGDPVWPNPGATQLSKTAKPTGNPGEWEITLKVEGKNLKTSSDVVLVIDKSGSMNDKVNKQKKMDKAKEAANKFVDNLLLNGADTKIAVVAFNRTSELVSSFKGPNQKAALKTAINGIHADGGTNIQAGIKQAHELLTSNQSQAENKIIVLLSDGEPTYSYKGIAATDYSWSNNGYDSSYPFAITEFDYDRIVGSGSSYKVDYGFGEWIRDSWFSGHYQYEVKDNGIGTFSEAKLAREAGHKLFSVGLDVDKNSNAEKVLKNIKSEGYYSASNDDLNKIFGELAGKISYAAQDAKVIDPMGDMFNLKMRGEQISVQDYTVSQGEVDWDSANEKFTWNIGNIAEGEPAVFTYKVVMDLSKNPVSNTLYPTNGKTTLEYKDVNNRNVTKDFEVPKVSIGNGSILMKGYKVNANGQPINAEGIEVEGPEFAEELYSEYYKDQTGNEALPIGSKEYSIPAKEVAGYQLKVGEDPTKVRLTATNPTPVIWFGYEEVVERTVTVKFLEKGTEKKLAEPLTVSGKIGETLNLEAVDVTDYTPENATAQYTVKAEGNEYIFYYTANSTEPEDNRTVTVRYVDKDTQKDLMPSQPYTGKVGEVITLTATDYTDSVTGAVYKPHTYNVAYTFTEDQVQQFVFEYTPDKSSLERSVTIHHVDRESNEELIAPTTELGYAGRTLVLYPEPISVTDAVYYPEQLEYGFEITLDPVQEFTIYYTKGEPTDLAQLTVSYLDRETGAELATPEMIKGRIGDKIELTAKEVLGYTPETVKYTHEFIDDPNQAHVFYYTKDAPADRQLTVKYLENGTNRQLASPTVVTGKPGETKTLAALSVSGYTPVKSTDTYTFNDEEGQEFIFYYTRNSSNPGGSDNSGDSGNSGNSGDSGSPTPPSTPEVTPLPPLPAVPPTLDTENHFQYIHGYPDGTVKPLNNITREEVATIFYRLLDDESRSAYLKTGTSLSDVEAKRWSNPSISTMENAGIVTGYPNGTFKPGQYITRAEFAAIASRFDKLDERPNDRFSDIKGHWAEKYIASAANKGWINGYTDGTFKPDQYITRAEAAKFINSVLNRKVDEAGLHEDAKMWPDNAKGMWYYYEILEATNHHDYSREESGVEVWEEVKPNRVYP